MKILVTGAGGFLGRAVTHQLLRRGHQVVGFNRSDHPDLRHMGVDLVRGDLADRDAVVHAAAHCNAVVHIAAKAGVWGPREEFVRTNVTGTENVLAACRDNFIGTLVYTSTPSVVHAGGDIEGADESLPYPAEFETHYPETKARAERMVLAANGEQLATGGVLHTVALRPHLIWGPGDNHLVPRIVDRARRGRLAIVGDGRKLVDGVFIDNAAEAHVLALEQLVHGGPCAGRAYFITNDEPIATADLINRIVAAAGLPEVTRHVSPTLAYRVGAVLEFLYGLFGIREEPPMTRFVAKQLSTAHWYDISAARRDLGYVPRVGIDEGMERLRRQLQRQLH